LFILQGWQKIGYLSGINQLLPLIQRIGVGLQLALTHEPSDGVIAHTEAIARFTHGD